MADKKSAGQPTKYNAAALKTAIAYIDNYNTKYEHAVPSVAGLAVILKVARTTIYNWSEDPKNAEFLYTLSRIATNQEFKLLNGGLLGEFNPTITKLMLAGHGHSEKVDPEVDEESPPLQYTFNVKPAAKEIKTTNAKS